MSQSAAHAHADLVDAVLAIPIVKAKLDAGKTLRVCPICYRLYEDFLTPDSVPYCTTCYPSSRNNFSRGGETASVEIQNAPDDALRLIIEQLGAKA